MSYTAIPHEVAHRRYKSAIDATVQARINIEKRIVRSLVNELIDAGFVLSLDNGEDEVNDVADASQFLKHTAQTDEERIYARKGDVQTWAHLVYGNDGYDVISDSGITLDSLTPNTQALIERLSA
jgi:hypothetical protein